MIAKLTFEIFGLLLTAGGFLIAYITLRHKFKKEEQEHNKLQTMEFIAHAEWKKKIEFEIEKLKLSQEEIRLTRQKNLSEIWKEIETIKKEHYEDMKEIGCQFEELLKELRTKNDELVKLVTAINNTMIKLATQFEDHREQDKELKKK